jgi:hypothetical protein
MNVNTSAKIAGILSRVRIVAIINPLITTIAGIRR